MLKPFLPVAETVEKIFTSEKIEPPNNTQQQTNIYILSSLILNGNYFGNTVSTKEVVVKIIYQAKQHDFASWDTIGEIKINLGE